MKRGFTLLEIIVVIGILAATIAILSASLITTTLERKTSLKGRAASLLEEQLATLRTFIPADLRERSESRFLGLLYNRGNWQIKNATNAPSGSNVLELTGTISSVYKNITGLILLPAPNTSDFTFETKLLLPSGFTGNLGLMFRARDLENNYKVVLQSGALIIEKEIGGTRFELTRNLVNIAPNTWYTLRTNVTSSTINAWLNDVPLGTATDTSLDFGRLALFLEGPGQPRFDNVLVSAETTSTWNFDTDTAGLLPSEWKKFGAYDLPNGIDFLTISNYLGQDNLKLINARIDWRENNTTSSVSSTTLIAQ